MAIKRRPLLVLLQPEREREREREREGGGGGVGGVLKRKASTFSQPDGSTRIYLSEATRVSQSRHVVVCSL